MLRNIRQALKTLNAQSTSVRFEQQSERNTLAICLKTAGVSLAGSGEQPEMDLLIPEILANRNKGSINYRQNEVVINLPLAHRKPSVPFRVSS